MNALVKMRPELAGHFEFHVLFPVDSWLCMPTPGPFSDYLKKQEASLPCGERTTQGTCFKKKRDALSRVHATIFLPR